MPGTPYDARGLRVAVAITAKTSNTRQKLLDAPETGHAVRPLRISELPALRRNRLQGRRNRPWLQGVVDAPPCRRPGPRFTRATKCATSLPTSSNRRSKSSAHGRRRWSIRFRRRTSEEQRKHLARVERALEEEIRGRARYVKSIADADTTPAVRYWLTAVLDVRLDEPDTRSTIARKVTAPDPQLLLRARENADQLESELGSRRLSDRRIPC